MGFDSEMKNAKRMLRWGKCLPILNKLDLHLILTRYINICLFNRLCVTDCVHKLYVPQSYYETTAGKVRSIIWAHDHF